ncbi:MAG TPA: YetF domain-containing protein [Luteimonas sp.]|nr:YetF domain-containing protein [Luteimonas sp.]
MNDLLQLSAPWWHFVLRAVAIYLMVMLLVRISGKRAVGQFTPFDLVLLILIGNAVQNGLNGGDNSLTGAAILAICLIALNYLAAWLSSRSAAARKVIEGVPTVLAKDGHVFHDVLRRELVSKADFHEAMRQAGCLDVARVRLATLETDGHITLLVDEAGRHSPSPDPPPPG